MRPFASMPMVFFAAPLTGANTVNTMTTATTIFTLPANLLQANTTVIVNKQSYTPGLSIVGAYANAVNQIAITYMNTSNANITPANETYFIAGFPALVGTLGANLTASSYQQVCSITADQCIDLQNELQQALQNYGVIKGG
jgi:hypothetical protein